MTQNDGSIEMPACFEEDSVSHKEQKRGDPVRKDGPQVLNFPLTSGVGVRIRRSSYLGRDLVILIV